MVLAVTAVLAAGCAAQGPTPSPAPSGSLAPAPGVTTLAEEGYREGPAALVPIPADAKITQYVDQPNVLAASFSEPSGERIAAVLREELPDAGWTITADTDAAVIFSRPGWQGHFTIADTTSALSIRSTPQ